MVWKRFFFKVLFGYSCWERKISPKTVMWLQKLALILMCTEWEAGGWGDRMSGRAGWWDQAACCAPGSCRSSKPLPLLGCGCPALQHRSSLQILSTAAMEQGSCTACYVGRRERSSWNTLVSLQYRRENLMCRVHRVYHCSSLCEVLTVKFWMLHGETTVTVMELVAVGLVMGYNLTLYTVSIISIMRFLKNCLFLLQLTSN